MTEQISERFSEQGGAATMDPSPVLRWLTSKMGTHLANPKRRQKQRDKVEQQRVKMGAPHRLEYFHQVDDGYSHLAAQALAQLLERYDIEIVCHLVTAGSGNNTPEPDLLLKLAKYDAECIASQYGLDMPIAQALPPASLVAKASAILARQSSTAFIGLAAEIGTALWRQDKAALEAIANRHGSAQSSQLSNKLAEGNARREELKHYSGAMFYYAAEWYWGVDRLHHLENRLVTLGVVRQPQTAILFPNPEVVTSPHKDKGNLTLEIFPSLRSPYTAISFDRTLELAQKTGVNLNVRPVLPMVMRGVPATRQKGTYIFFDAAREASEAGIDYGKFYDPIGDPVRRCYSLYPWACEQSKGNALISSFLKSAFAQGINTNNDKGMKHVIEQAGLSWEQAKTRVGQPGWEEGLEQNRLAMYDAGLWGVPSFRLLDHEGKQVLAVWGQDRLWLVAQKIQQLLA
jgi:2-hydroxychromene-2-carboxylate isomerase